MICDSIKLVWNWIILKFMCFEIQPIGNTVDLKLNWFQTEWLWDSIDLRFNCLESQFCFRFDCFDGHLIWAWIDLRLSWFKFKRFQSQLVWNSNDLVVSRTEIQLVWTPFVFRFNWQSIDLRFNCFGSQEILSFENQLVIDSSGLMFNCFCQLIRLFWDSTDLRFRWRIFSWFQIQFLWKPTALRFNWFEIDLKVQWLKWFEFQLLPDSKDLNFNLI